VSVCGVAIDPARTLRSRGLVSSAAYGRAPRSSSWVRRRPIEGMRWPTPPVSVRWEIFRTGSQDVARELSLRGITSLEWGARHSREDLLAILGVGPKAIRILDGALAEEGLSFDDS
jgi:hypothetical protein